MTLRHRDGQNKDIKTCYLKNKSLKFLHNKRPITIGPFNVCWWERWRVAANTD